MGELVQGVFGLAGARQQARAAERAAQTAANAQVEAARIAAEEARFRPVGITTRFGTSRFEMSPEGRLVSAGYDVSPELAAIQDRLLSQAGGAGAGLSEQALGATQGLFNLGQQYLATSPEEAAAQYMERQQAALAPAREKALSRIRQNLFNTGRGGLAVAQGGTMGAANPELQAYYNALAQQDLNLAAQAQQEGRAATEFGAGLFGLGSKAYTAGLSPLQTSLGVSQEIEKLGQSPLDIGSALGGRVANPTGANALLSGGLAAARTLQGPQSMSPVGSTLMGMAQNPALANKIATNIGNWFSSTPPMTAASSSGGWGTGDYFGNQDLGAFL